MKQLFMKFGYALMHNVFGQVHRPRYRLPKMNLMFIKVPLRRFLLRVRYLSKKFHAKNWTSQRGGRGPVHKKSIYH